VAQAAVVEQDARDDQRACEAAATRFVRAGDEARAELAVEPEELLAGAQRHGPRLASYSEDSSVASGASGSETSLGATSACWVARVPRGPSCRSSRTRAFLPTLPRR